MNLSRKRLLVGLSLSLVLMPTAPTKTYEYSTNNPAVIAGFIVAGIAGIGGMIYGLVKYFQKSPEQILDDAEKAFDTAHQEGRRFYSEYMNVFQRVCYGEPTLNDIESNFLEVVAYRAYVQGVNIEDHIYAVQKALESLKKTLEEVKGAVKNLQSRKRTPLYDRLVAVEDAIEAELGYLKAYHQRFSEHCAYFTLAVFELKLRHAHEYEIRLLQQYPIGSYQLESQLVQRAKAYREYSDYPMVYYYELVRDYRATLERYIRNLRFWYPKRVPAARELIEYFAPICNIIVDTAVFKEERELKKADDARREQLELRRREVQAAERQAQAAKEQARAAEQQALAAQQQAIAAQQAVQQARAQQTVVVVQQTVVQQAAPAQQAPAAGQNGGADANAQNITIGQGNNQRTVSVEWFEQNKPGAADAYIAA